LAGRPPFVIVREEQVALGAASISNENITELLCNLATVEQMKEFNACSDAQFIYLFRNWARFGVSASLAHRIFRIKIRNPGRWPSKFLQIKIAANYKQ
jgi:hypothetical protein